MTLAGNRRLKADLALVGVSFVWGATFVVVKEALDGISTVLFLTIRFIIAAIVLWFTFRGRGAHYPRDRRKELRAGAIIGFFLFSGYVLQTMGLKYTTASKTGFITGFYIVLVPLFAAIVYRKVPELSEVLGVVLAMAGTALLTLQSLRFDMNGGDLLVLASTGVYACHILVLGHFSKRMTFESLSVNQIAAGAVFGALSFWWIETPRVEWTGPVLFALVVTSLLCTAVAFSVQSWAQQFTTATRTALIFALEPVFAWLTAYLASGETLTARAAGGAVMILAGILLVELKPIGFGRHPSARTGVSLQD